MVRGSTRVAQFGAPIRGKEASSRPAQGRICDHAGCVTVLSTYNASGSCWLHSDPTTRHSLARS